MIRIGILLAIVCLLPAGIQAGNVTLHLEPGFVGPMPAGNWAYVAAAIENSGELFRGYLEIRLESPDAVQGTYQFPLHLLPGERTEITWSLPLYQRPVLPVVADPGRWEERLNAGTDWAISGDVISADGFVARARLPLTMPAEAGSAILVLSETASGYDFLRLNPDAPLGVFYAGASRLPTGWDGLRPFEAVLVSDVRMRDLSSQQEAALLRWVELGGRLIFTGSSLSQNANWEPLRQRVQVAAGGPILLPLEQVTGNLAAVLPFDQAWIWPLEMRDQEEAGAFLAAAGETVLAAEISFGRGRLQLLAFEPGHYSIIEWPQKAEFFFQLVTPSAQSLLSQSSVLEPAAFSFLHAIVPAMIQRDRFLRIAALLLVAVLFCYAAALRRGPVLLVVLLVFAAAGFTVVPYLLYGRDMSAAHTALHEVAVMEQLPNSETALVDSYYLLFAQGGRSASLMMPRSFSELYLPGFDAPSALRRELPLRVTAAQAVVEVAGPDSRTAVLLRGHSSTEVAISAHLDRDERIVHWHNRSGLEIGRLFLSMDNLFWEFFPRTDQGPRSFSFGGRQGSRRPLWFYEPRFWEGIDWDRQLQWEVLEQLTAVQRSRRPQQDFFLVTFRTPPASSYEHTAGSHLFHGFLVIPIADGKDEAR